MIYYSLNLKVPKNVLEKRVVKANKWLCEEIIKDTDQFVPARTGALAMNVHRQGIPSCTPLPMHDFSITVR